MTAGTAIANLPNNQAEAQRRADVEQELKDLDETEKERSAAWEKSKTRKAAKLKEAKAMRSRGIDDTNAELERRRKERDDKVKAGVEFRKKSEADRKKGAEDRSAAMFGTRFARDTGADDATAAEFGKIARGRAVELTKAGFNVKDASEAAFQQTAEAVLSQQQVMSNMQGQQVALLDVMKLMEQRIGDMQQTNSGIQARIRQMGGNQRGSFNQNPLQ